MEAWEYLVEHVQNNTGQVTALLNKMSALGWDFVSCAGETRLLMIFRRPRQAADRPSDR